MARNATERIEARQLRNYERDAIRLILYSIVICIAILPLMSGDVQQVSLPVHEPVNNVSLSDNDLLLTIRLTHSPDCIAPGVVDSYRGFAYADQYADVVRFIDPINDVTLNQTIESGTVEETILTGADIDNDGSTEFLLVNDNGTVNNLLVVDFNDATTTIYNTSIEYPTDIATGYFNDDTFLDVAIFDIYGVETLDIHSDQRLGIFMHSGFDTDCYSIGRFIDPTEDSIALGIYDAAKNGNFTIIAGNGTILRTTMMHVPIMGMANFDYGPGLDDLAIMMFDGNLTTLSPSTMTVLYNITGLPERSLVTTGVLNFDGQTDLLVAPMQDNYTVFIDGANGDIIRYSVKIAGVFEGAIAGDPPSPLIDGGFIDDDNLTDFAILEGTARSAAFLRGSDGNIGYEEPSISSKPTNIRVFDINNNTRDDILVLEGSNVYVMFSDVTAPILYPETLSPPHPTIRDPYIEIEVGIDDDTSIILADIYLRFEDGNWSQPVDELQNAGTQYFAFLVGLPEGYYEYYLVFQDTYLNIGTLGNETHPVNFTIAGNLAWTDTKYQSTALGHQLMDIGNTSTGEEVIYTLDSSSDVIYLDRYTPRGEKQSLGVVANRTFSDFWIYTGMMDGDHLLDPIILLYNATAEIVNVTIYHGNTGTLWYSTQYPYNHMRDVQSAQAYDCDRDGIDEFFFVFENSSNSHDVYLARLKADGFWSNVSVTGGSSETHSLSLAYTLNDNTAEAALSSSGTGHVDIFNASSMTLISTHNVTRIEFDITIPIYLRNYHNASESRTKFLLYMYFMDPSGISYGFHVFDGSTPRINETVFFEGHNELYLDLNIVDLEGDGTDELVGVSYITGDIALLRLDTPITVEWSVPLSTADFLSSVIVDFDGDGQDEIGVFTKQDTILWIVSLNGKIERELNVGEGHGCKKLSNIDLGYGEEIVSYPLVQDGVTKIGVIRDIVLIRRLNASLTYSTEELLQSESLDIYVDVSNIYSEEIPDAEVFFTVHYKSGGSIITQTSSLIYDISNYSTTLAATWPIGVVNFSLTISHDLYDVYEEYYPNTLVVKSDLSVEVYTKSLLMQNQTLTADVAVTDSLGTRVSDASVDIELDGTHYAVAYSVNLYRLLIPNIGLKPGEYTINASASHEYSDTVSYATISFSLVANEINISRFMPNGLEQNNEFVGWLNLTDIFDHPIENAQVTIVGAGLELFLSELEPGCYYLNSTAAMGLGNHTFEIQVVHDYIQGSTFGDFYVATVGSITPNVPDISAVSGGDLFNVTVFISDEYGTTPDDTWVCVEIDGTNYTASKISGNSFRVQLNATYSIGKRELTIYYRSAFIHDGKIYTDLNVHSNPILSLSPSSYWTVSQSDTTLIEVAVKDWLGVSIGDASVSLRIRGVPYTLTHVVNGLYSTNISTVGWPYGSHPYQLTVEHEYLYIFSISGELSVIAEPTITIIPSTEVPEQFTHLTVTVEVTDIYENPITNLEVVVEFAGMRSIAEESNLPGTYFTIFDVGNTYFGTYNISVQVNGTLASSGRMSKSIFVEVSTPDNESLSAETVSVAGGLSLLLSLIGMILFVKVSSSVSTTPRKKDDITKSIRQIDRIYLVIVAISGLLFLHSWSLFSAGEVALALLESILLLGSSVLLYGIWLYRDAYSSILLQGRLSKRRIALGIWHLTLVPFIVLLIFYYGPSFQFFDRYVMSVEWITVGGFSFPPILATILATYMSSIVVVVISFYREIRKGLKRIDDMIVSGTPKNVVDEEQVLLIGRTGASIRIKFLMFLLILGATTVVQLDFILKNYSMAAIVLVPILFLVLIPFISSRLVRGLPKMMKRLRGRSSREDLEIPLVE
ncbi:MAG: conserved membrane protein of unknown function [Candidatus Thorarchaeota archaeon]|nr:MAG: conserved membrane protein of unknown function [Candidatus Thorarchaeota archaeon]